MSKDGYYSWLLACPDSDEPQLALTVRRQQRVNDEFCSVTLIGNW